MRQTHLRLSQLAHAPRAMSSSSAAPAVTEGDVTAFLAQSVNEFSEACRKGFTEHKFDPIVAGITIGNHIMNELINKAIAGTQAGQKTMMDNADLFTMTSVLAKTNVAMLTSLERAQYHEKMSRALTAEVNKIKETTIETEEKVNNQANAEELLNKMAEMMKGTGGKGGIG